MSSSTSAYTAFATLLGEAALPVSPAELQGHLLGRICGGAGFDESHWLVAAAELLGGAPSERLQGALSGLLGMVAQEFTAREPALTLLLPDDEAPLAERTRALGQWSQGFLAGFGLSGRQGALSAEATEVLQDLAAIAQVQDNFEESEAGEGDFMEVSEYLRIAPLLLYGEYGQDQASAAAPVVH